MNYEVLPGKIGTTDLTHTLTPLSTFYLRNMNRIELILTLWSPSLPYQLCISSRSAKGPFKYYVIKKVGG